MVLTSEPRENASLQAIWRVLGSLRNYRWASLGALISLLVLTVANTVTPQLFRWAIDQGIVKQDLQIVIY
ncbi:ABC transporter ATP-binding protein, partial [Nostoc sp. NIES-2111]